MNDHRFFVPSGGVRLSQLAVALGAELLDPSFADRVISAVAPVYRARENELGYLVSRKHKDELLTTQAGAILCTEDIRPLVPSHVAVLLSRHPHGAFAEAGRLLHPDAATAVRLGTQAGISPKADIHPDARLEDNVTVDAFAVIGPGAAIGTGTVIGAGALIGPGVQIGRNCSIAAGASILCACLGNSVIIHNGARIGQDGFGYAPGPKGMSKIVQVGRVLIQDHVEIGANTTIDRGTMDDTVIGEGTKIDNQVQIGHNVRIGRHCAIVAKVGIAGSAKIGDGVMIGGASGINGHITIGDGVQISAMSGVMLDVPAGKRMGGNPARPLQDYLRDTAEMMNRTGKRKQKQGVGNE